MIFQRSQGIALRQSCHSAGTVNGVDLSASWKGIKCGLCLSMCNTEWMGTYRGIMNVHEAGEQGEDEDVMMDIATHDGLG